MARTKEKAPCPELFSLRLSLKALKFEPFLRKNSRKMAEPRVHRGGTDPLLKCCRAIPKLPEIYTVWLESAIGGVGDWRDNSRVQVY
jgi:hypothetical protein